MDQVENEVVCFGKRGGRLMYLWRVGQKLVIPHLKKKQLQNNGINNQINLLGQITINYENEIRAWFEF